MKRYIALLVCVAAVLAAGCKAEKPEENIVFTGTIEELYDNGILVFTADDVGFDKASVRFDADLEISFNLLVGQVVKLTILPQINESYPVQVTAVAIELVSQPDTSGPAVSGPAATGPSETSPGQIAYHASFHRVNSSSDKGFEFFAERSENPEKMLLSSVRHIPVVAIRSAEEFAAFLEEGEDYFYFDTAYENGSFADAAKAYDDAFFADSWLLLLYTRESSGSICHEIADVVISGEALSVAITATSPEIGTADIADWFILLEFASSDTAACTEFDAYYAA